jgi:hypothetical protein
MTVIRTRKEDVYPSDNYEDLTRSLKSAIASSLWRETNKAKIATIQQLCEFLKTVTQERLESLQD